jgi:hypothetical protein
MKGLLLIVLFLPFCQTPCFAQVLYQLDDGSAELGITSGAPREALALNCFDAVEGGRRIINISGVWGSVATPGAPAYVVLFSDPNNDCDPSDAHLLVQVPTTFGTTGSSFSMDIPPTDVSGKFFAGVLWLNPNGDLWLGYDPDTNSNGRSWFVVSNPGGTINLNDISSNIVYSEDEVIVIRAEGVPLISIPTMTEWGMIIFMVLAGLGAVYFMRRRKRTNI